MSLEADGPWLGELGKSSAGALGESDSGNVGIVDKHHKDCIIGGHVEGYAGAAVDHFVAHIFLGAGIGMPQLWLLACDIEVGSELARLLGLVGYPVNLAIVQTTVYKLDVGLGVREGDIGSDSSVCKHLADRHSGSNILAARAPDILYQAVKLFDGSIESHEDLGRSILMDIMLTLSSHNTR